MDYQNNLNSKREAVHPIVIWIIASILFHLLLALGIITLKVSTLPLTTQKKQTQDHAILMMDEPKKQQTQALPQQQPPAQKKEVTKKEKQEKPKEEPKLKWSDYTLVPGRQGINQQNLDDPQNLKNMPKPEDQKLNKKERTLKELDSRSKPGMTNNKIKENESQTTDIQENTRTSESKNIQQEKNKSNVIPDSEQESKSFKTQPLTQFSDQEQKKSSIKEKLKKEFKTPISEQDPYEFVPQPSRVISFQDLNLGFDNRYATIGNNANLIQQGITMAAPDEVSLKHLTYYNQCAGMMKTAFATHPQTHLRQNATGKRFRFDLVVDRQGNQLELRVIQGSGDIILDRIIQESIASVRIFPKVPSFIPDSPFVMRWTFLH